MREAGRRPAFKASLRPDSGPKRMLFHRSDGVANDSLTLFWR
jgi:hypothetical protein